MTHESVDNMQITSFDDEGLFRVKDVEGNFYLDDLVFIVDLGPMGKKGTVMRRSYKAMGVSKNVLFWDRIITVSV